MSRLRSLSASHSPVASPGLKVIDEAYENPRWSAPPSREMPRWDALSPMPLAGVQAQEEEEIEIPSPDNYFEHDFLPSRQAGDDGKLRELPRFVPLQCEVFEVTGDPWAVRSVGDLLKLYLPEISISTGVIAAAGLIAGRLVSRFGGGAVGPEILGVYLAVQALCLAVAYTSAKGSPSVRGKERMKFHLLGTFLVLGVHMLAYGLLVAGR